MLQETIFLALSCYVHKKKKLKYKPQRCTANIPKFPKLISFTELIMNFLKIAFSHKCNALSLKEQSQSLEGFTSAVQKRSMYLDRSFDHGVHGLRIVIRN